MIITQTPLRVSILGGNTDFADYFKEYGLTQEKLNGQSGTL